MRRQNFFSKNPIFKRAKMRSVNGTTLAEFGPTLLLAFAMMVFPMMALGTLGLRYILLLNATELAAEAGSKSKTFLNDTTQVVSGVTQTSYSAVHQASTVSQLGCKGIGNGAVVWKSTNTYIYSCPLGGTTLTTPGANTPLSSAASSNNIYNCVVIVNADIQPMFPGAGSIVGSIPGFNTKMNVTCQSSRFFESTANLTQ